MTRQAVTATDVPPAAGPYSSAIKHNDLAFLSGQGPYDKNGTLAGPDIRSQTRQTLDNLAAVARGRGMSLEQCCAGPRVPHNDGELRGNERRVCRVLQSPLPSAHDS